MEFYHCDSRIGDASFELINKKDLLIIRYANFQKIVLIFFFNEYFGISLSEGKGFLLSHLALYTICSFQHTRNVEGSSPQHDVGW